MTNKTETTATEFSTEDLVGSSTTKQVETKNTSKTKSKKTKTNKVAVLKHPLSTLPEYKTKGSAGCDVYANINLPMWIKPGETKLVPTGLRVKIPEGYEIQVRSRSGLSLKKGLVVLNAPGTIDSDYPDEIGLIMHNFGNHNVEVKKNDRLAQLVLVKVDQISWEEVDEDTFKELHGLSEREGGFGSTGV